MTFEAPTPTELRQIMNATGLTTQEFGEAIGYGDPERTVRALTKGERRQEPYAMSGAAINSLRYMLALFSLTAAHHAYREDQTADNEAKLADSHDAAVAILPKRLRP